MTKFRFINKAAFVGCEATTIVLTGLLNVVVIAFVVYLFRRRLWTRHGSPKLVLVLTSCVLGLLVAVSLYAEILHTDIEDTLYSHHTCDKILALAVSAVLTQTILRLLVAAVITAETLHLQTVMTLTPVVQMVSAVALLVLSVVYAPVIFTVELADAEAPCYEGTNIIRYENDLTRKRAFATVGYLIPVVLIIGSCCLLVVAYVTRRRSTGQGQGRPGSLVMPQSVPSVGPKATPTTKTTGQTTGQSLACTPTTTPTGQTTGQSLACTPASLAIDRPFPLYALLAGIGVLILGFLQFLFFFMDIRETFGLDTYGWMNFWAAGYLLTQMESVLVPGCWLLDLCILHLGDRWRLAKASGLTHAQDGTQDDDTIPLVKFDDNQ